MTKKEKTEIKEVIEHILQFRTKEIWDNENVYSLAHDWEEKDKLNAITKEKYDKPLIKLNNLLKEKDRYKEILEIEKLQAKKYVSTKELADLYPNMSLSTQVTLRGRIHDKLPYHQNVAGGKIMYIIEEVEIWRENQHK